MRRILFTCFGREIYSYPAMLYVGLLAGFMAGAQIAPSFRLDADRFAIAGVVLVVPGLLGARLLYVLMHWDVYAKDLGRIWRRREGGMAMYGGFALMIAVSIPLLHAMALPFWAFWDVGTIAILVAMVFTRLGCLLNGCCAGRPTDGWCGLDLPDHRGVWRRRVPTQVLEMGWAALLLAALLVVRGQVPFSGAVFCAGVGGYGAGRYFLQRLRDDAGGKVESGILQVLSVVLVLTAIGAGVCALLG
jgi:phosphatidylglycerol:prolipoprotein diacylglycerol transferase